MKALAWKDNRKITAKGGQSVSHFLARLVMSEGGQDEKSEHYTSNYIINGCCRNHLPSAVVPQYNSYHFSQRSHARDMAANVDNDDVAFVPDMYHCRKRIVMTIILSDTPPEHLGI
jgi:type IV secretory pathway VirB6-like protein